MKQFNLIFLYTATLLFTLINAQNESYLVDYCSDYSHYNEGSEFQSNLNLLTSKLTSKSNTTKFYNFTVIGTPESTVYGLFLCNKFITTQECQDCVSTAISEIQQKCSFSKVYTVWYALCMVRYSDQPIFSIKDTSIYYNFVFPPTDYGQFSNLLSKGFNNLFSKVTTENSSSLTSEESSVNVTKDLSLDFYVDCTPDLSQADCYSCLKTGLDRDLMLGGRIGILLQQSCRLMYAFNDTRPPTLGNKMKKASCKEQNIGLGVSSVLAAAFLVLYSFDHFKRRKKMVKPAGTESIGSKENLNFDINAIKAATDGFSPSNELGRGGFGVVYKGTFSDGQAVAIKRLSNASQQGTREFKTEACLAAKLQHKNLVKLYGYCQEEDEMLLIYEYVHNKSLDRFLFDVKQHECLNWETRYKIIVGIARGLSYLHEESDPKIIHRDLKPSNILLDSVMSPKIADFGMAKMFGGDQSQGDTSRVAGTFGYMAPEYVSAGHFSNKSDIFSYGVILLEIISGKRNYFSKINSPQENLLNYAWRLWNDESQLMLVDTAIKTNLREDEVERCIRVGLMCIQEDPAKRPSIDSVLFMLHTQPTTLLPSTPPPAFPYKRNKEEVSHEDSQCLLNDSDNELYPR